MVGTVTWWDRSVQTSGPEVRGFPSGLTILNMRSLCVAHNDGARTREGVNRAVGERRG